MKYAKYIWLAVLLVFLGGLAQEAFAADEFYGDNPADPPPTSFTGNSAADVVEQARADHATWCTATWGGVVSGARVHAGPTYVGVTSGKHRWNYTVTCQRVANNNELSSVNGIVFADENSCDGGADPSAGGECPAECTAHSSGVTKTISAAGSAPANVCLDECGFTKVAGVSVELGGYYVAEYTTDGGTCAGGATEPNASDVGLNCIQTSSGTQYCADTGQGQNCGTVNGEYVCLGNTPPGNCLFTPNGQAICDGDSQTASPDDTITDDESNEYDIYSDGDTGGTAGGSGDSQGSNNTGSNDEETENECENESCEGELPGENEAVDGFDSLFAGFWARVQGSNLVSAVGDIGDGMGAGECSAFDSDPIGFLDGAVLSIDAHCTLWPEVEPILSGVMLAFWSLTGVVVVMRA